MKKMFKKWLSRVTVTCLDMNVYPVQSDVCVELLHVAHSHPNQLGIVSIPLLPTIAGHR